MEHLFHAKIHEGLYLISSDACGKSMDFGKPTANAYLVVGETKALLFDLSVNLPGVGAYAETVADKPTMVVLSHGHPDHIYHLEEAEEISIHEADRHFPLCKELGLPAFRKIPIMRFLQHGDTIELGNRLLRVIHIAGHTMGSICLFDEKTGVLLSGDTVARRLLYGLTGCPPLSEFCDKLLALRSLPITAIHSAHDRAAIAPDHIDKMVLHIQNDLAKTRRRWQFPGFPKMVNFVSGNEKQADFFDIAVPVEAIAALK